MSSILQIAPEPSTTTAPQALRPLVLRTVVVFFLCAIPAWTARQLTDGQFGWISPLIFQGVMLVATAALLRRSGIDSGQSGMICPSGLRWTGYLPLAVALEILSSLVLIRNHSYFLAGGDPISTAAAFFWTGLYVPFAEELFLRGWFQTSLARALDSSSSRIVVLSSATVFALLHLGWYLRGRSGTATTIGVVAAFFLGWMCARAREQTQSLLPAFAIHVVFNVTGILVGAGLNYMLSHPSL